AGIGVDQPDEPGRNPLHDQLRTEPGERRLLLERETRPGAHVRQAAIARRPAPRLRVVDHDSLHVTQSRRDTHQDDRPPTVAGYGGGQIVAPGTPERDRYGASAPGPRGPGVRLRRQARRAWRWRPAD